jgi:hypothetical protein
MDIPSPSLRELAQQLLSIEAESNSDAPQAHEAVRVCERLRVSLRDRD